jgi:arylsulfatase A-like enzyme
LYGYGRNTTPNIDRLAQRATVYHNHFAGSNFTTTGTAALLTGTLPWTNRALLQNGTVAKKLVSRNIFSVFKDYQRVAYSHNEWVNTLLAQFREEIDEWIPKEQLVLRSSDTTVQKIFHNDPDVASVSWVRNMKVNEAGYAYSLFLSRLVSFFDDENTTAYKPLFPRGIPTASGTGRFLLEHAIDWIADRFSSLKESTLGYFHLLPPHAPYNTPGEFVGKLRHDDFQTVEKPVDIFATEQGVDFAKKRAYYDEYIMYVDREFNRLFTMLEESGRLEDTWLVLTSDHGEMFERGISEHLTNVLYQPVIRVPLLIFEPGKTERKDIYTPTSAVDLLPTLAHLTGEQIPAWSEGAVLPPYQTNAAEKKVYVVLSKETTMGNPIKQGSLVFVKGIYKLHYYFGYPELNGEDLVKLYDIESDPEELENLAASQNVLAEEMLLELKTKLAEADKPYLGNG